MCRITGKPTKSPGNKYTRKDGKKLILGGKKAKRNQADTVHVQASIRRGASCHTRRLQSGSLRLQTKEPSTQMQGQGSTTTSHQLRATAPDTAHQRVSQPPSSVVKYSRFNYYMFDWSLSVVFFFKNAYHTCKNSLFHQHSPVVPGHEAKHTKASKPALDDLQRALWWSSR